jgi:hypothetical protein
VFLLSAPSALAQLADDCTVSIRNRAAKVRADGSWTVDNIPFTGEDLRARATCSREGVTLSGRSSFATMLPGSDSAFDSEISVVVGAAAPASLSLTAPVSSLSAIGATVQLAATANFSDGSMADVTPFASGTTYVSSNSAIASVSPDGLVTAAGSGAALISALNDGVLGLVSISVMIEGADSDGDGIPDEVEISFGLNPNNPADAMLDLDNDGLDNLAEYTLGTALDNPDSDGDGIQDGLEIQTSTDPNDPLSFDLAVTLTAIRVTPTFFTLALNEIRPVSQVVSRQLAVEGDLLDGSTIDLTLTARQTTYDIDDIEKCTLGGADGEVFAAAEGSCKIGITNNGFTTESTGLVREHTPVTLSQLIFPGSPNNVDVNGGIAVVAAGIAGVHIVDVSDRANPAILATADTPGEALDVKIAGTLAYVADGAAGLQIVDFSNPMAPLIIGSADTAGSAADIAVGAGLALIADSNTGLQILDVSNPAGPFLAASEPLPGETKAVAIDAARRLALAAVLEGGAASLHVFDVSNPSSPDATATALLGHSRQDSR